MVRQHLVTNATSTGSELELGICIFREELGEYIHSPIGYGANFARNHPDMHPVFCTQCMLQPCFNEEYKQEIFGHGHRLVASADAGTTGGLLEDDKLVSLHARVCETLIERARSILRSLFGEQCTKRYETLPRCVWYKILSTFPSSDDYCQFYSEDEEDNSDFITKKRRDAAATLVGPISKKNKGVYIKHDIDLTKDLSVVTKQLNKLILTAIQDET